MARNNPKKKAARKPKASALNRGLIKLEINQSAILTSLSGMTEICGLLNDRWWRHPKTGRVIKRNDGEMIALMHSELSEALEGVRKDKQDDHLPHLKSVDVELADLLIRVFDYCHRRKINLGSAFIQKNVYNAHRPDHKPENRLKKGGKKF